MTRDFTDKDIERMLRAYFNNEIPEGRITREELHALLERDNMRIEDKRGFYIKELEHIQELIWLMQDHSISDIQKQKAKNSALDKLAPILPDVIELLKI